MVLNVVLYCVRDNSPWWANVQCKSNLTLTRDFCTIVHLVFYFVVEQVVGVGSLLIAAGICLIFMLLTNQ